ncbi:MAG: DNA translocase FtsK [Anaerolineae bacterium]
MARRTQTSKKEDAGASLGPANAAALIKSLYRRGILGVLLLALAIVTLTGLLQESSGLLIDWWSALLQQLLGWGSYVVTLLVAAVGALILAGKMPKREQVPWHVIVGAEIIFLAALSLTHMFAPGPDPWQTAQAGGGGGLVGAVFSGVLREVLGRGFGAVVLGIVLLWGAVTASGLTFEEWADRIELWAVEMQARMARLLTGERAKEQQARDAQSAVPPSAVPQSAVPRSAAPQSEPAASPPAQPAGVQRNRRYKVSLPPLGLLDRPAQQDVDEADVQHKKRIIEVTLAQFGIPSEVVEINRGPVVTQFGVEPGYVTQTDANGQERAHRVRVARIASLNNDLALALSAAPIRIEAPFPGRSLVGIEVPNSRVSVVSLRKVMEASSYDQYKSNLTLPLGEGVAGKPVIADLAKMPHLLIAGTTGSGKSVCINALATSLIFQNSPLTLRLVMIDPKRVEMRHYDPLPHLYGKVENDADRIVAVLHWLVNEMQERYRKFAQVGARHIDEYNARWRVGSSEHMPRIVTFIDELADLMFFAPDEVEKSICRLAQMARATGMHLVVATQRPSVDVVTGLIKANFPARIGFTCSSSTDSRVILDTVGAETLLGKGDLLFMSPDSSQLVRAQGSSVSPTEIERAIHYWLDWARREEWEKGPAPWEDVIEREEATTGDDLIERAIEIVREQGSASASMLQRRMHIGYPRAARLIDDLEQLGIVGPQLSGGRPRELLGPSFEAETSAGQGTGT